MQRSANVISIGPMLLSLPQNIKRGMQAEGYGGFPHYPPYYPKAFNRDLADNTTTKDIIISDTPWAVAWYADRMSVWLPKNLKQIEYIEELASNQQKPVKGIVISPYSFNSAPILTASNPGRAYGELFPLVYNAFGYIGTGQNVNFVDIHPKFNSLSKRYQHKTPLFSNGYIMYFSTTPVVPVTD